MMRLSLVGRFILVNILSPPLSNLLSSHTRGPNLSIGTPGKRYEVNIEFDEYSVWPFVGRGAKGADTKN